MARARLSLCLIARDEAALLPRCLSSVAGVVDEIVVVDTGSQDATRQIARSFGAKVVEEPWGDDFAAPRNRALAESSGEWVLVLDADERLTAAAGPAIRAAIDRAGFDLATLPLYNATRLDAEDEAVVSGDARSDDPVALSRLFRRQAGLRWTGVVHESVERWVLEAPRVQIHVDAPVVHVGYCAEVREARDKGRRNTALLEKQVAATPDDPIPRTYLARERHRAGRVDEAVLEAEKAWASYRRRRDRERRQGAAGRVSPISTATLLGYLWLERRRPKEVLDLCAEASRDAGPHPNLHLLSSLAHERLALVAPTVETREAHLVAAVRQGRAAAAWRGPSQAEILPGATGFQAWTRVGVALLLLGQLVGEEGAEAALQRAGAAAGESEARWAALEARIDRGEAAGVLPEIEDALKRSIPDAWILAAIAADRLGQAADRRAFLGVSRRLGGANTSPHRALRAAALAVLDACGELLPAPPSLLNRGGPAAGVADIQAAEAAFGNQDVALALHHLSRAARLDPFSWLLWLDLAVILASTGQLPPASGAITLALRLAPTARDVLITASEIEHALGRPKEAAQHLRRVLELFPDDDEARAALSALAAT